MSFGDHNTPTKAIKLITSTKNSDDDDFKVRVIHQYEEGGPTLESVLLHEDFKDLKILVFSIIGKARTGKSFLLNAMIKYLELNGNKGWERTKIEKFFEWKCGLESITRGLWIFPKIFKLKNIKNEEVGILLVDNQGLFDGEHSYGEASTISGISTAISYVQMFNLKEKICTNDLENIMEYLVSDMPRQEDEAIETWLMFLVRDFIEAEDFGCGLDKGQEYIIAEAKRGCEENKKLWKHLKEKFKHQKCLLLPNPGKKILSKSFEESRLLCELDTDFVQEIDKFFRTLFAPENLIPHNNTLTGSQLLSFLIDVDGKVVNKQLSFFNIMIEQRNQDKLDSLIYCFEHQLRILDTPNAYKYMKQLLAAHKNKFKGDSAEKYASKLERNLVDLFFSKEKRYALDLYNAKLNKYGTEAGHKNQWFDMKTRIGLLAFGPNRQKIIADVVKAAAAIYYENLRSEMENRYKILISKTENIEEISSFYISFITNFKKCLDFENEDIDDENKILLHSIWSREQLILKRNTEYCFHQKVDSLANVGTQWLERATLKQYKYFEWFTWGKIEEGACHRIKVHYQDVERLQELVAQAWFKQSHCDLSENQSKRVKSIVESILKERLFFDSIILTFIFLICKNKKTEFIEPIFKVKCIESSKWRFVDTFCRVYDDWEDFMKNNKLLDCVYCYPICGEYKKGGFEVGFAESPAASTGHKALRALDTAGDIISFVAVAGCTAAATTTVIPAAALTGAVAAGVGAGAYGLARGIAKITDKKSHKQSLGVGDVLNTVGNGLTIATAGTSAVAANLIKAGKEVRVLQSVIKGLSRAGIVTSIPIPVIKKSTHVPSPLIEDSDILTLYLLCFNSNSREEAINNIRLSYNSSDNVTVQDILKDFVDANSINYIFDDEETKFVSVSIRSLISDLLKSFYPLKPNLEVKSLSPKYRDVFVQKMGKLYNDLNQENRCVLTELKKFLIDPNNSETCGFLMSFINIESYEIIQFSLIFRSLIYSVLAKIEKASTIFDCLDHKSRCCQGFNLPIYSGIEFHSVNEVFEMIEFTDTLRKISSIIEYLLFFMKELHSKLSDDDWNFAKFSIQLIKNWQLISKSFDDELHDFEEQFKLLCHPNCVDIDRLLKENKIQGNLGLCLLKKSLQKSLVVKQVTHLDKENIIVPAWDGIVNHLYCYSHSGTSQKMIYRDLIKQLIKQTLIDDLKNFEGTVFEESHINNICVLKASVRDSPAYYIYQRSVEGLGMFGLIYCDRENIVNKRIVKHCC